VLDHGGAGTRDDGTAGPENRQLSRYPRRV